MSSPSQSSMYAWRLAGPGGSFTYQQVPLPEVRSGTVLVRMESTPILSYLKQYIAGVPNYAYPKVPFTPGTNGAGGIVAVGSDVWHLKVGQRVVVSPHMVVDENVEEPAQILGGLTAISPDSEPFFTTWRDGTLAEYLLTPAGAVTPVQDNSLSCDALALLGRLAVPFGGLLRGRLAPGETAVIVGATGNFGSAAVLLACALGAERVVAAGRNTKVLEEIARVAGKRVHPVTLTGDLENDAAALRSAAGGGAHFAFDMVGRAHNAEATLAGLKSLRRWGRLVLMGSMTVSLPLTYGEVMLNNLEIIGNFMYPANIFLKLLGPGPFRTARFDGDSNAKVSPSPVTGSHGRSREGKWPELHSGERRLEAAVRTENELSHNVFLWCYSGLENPSIFSILLAVMHPKEREIRKVATKAPFVPFTLVTASGERFKVPTPDHISFFPDTDEDGVLQAEEERAQSFIVYGKGVRYRHLFFDTITAIDLSAMPNPVPEQ